MSRAFVNEDNSVEDVPERPVSAHPNYVTPQGLAAPPQFGIAAGLLFSA